MLDKKLGNIDWNTSAVQIERLVRGLNSWPSAYTHWDKKVVKIWRAKAEADGTVKAEPGTVLSVEKDSLLFRQGMASYESGTSDSGEKENGYRSFLKGIHN